MGIVHLAEIDARIQSEFKIAKINEFLSVLPKFWEPFVLRTLNHVFFTINKEILKIKFDG